MNIITATNSISRSLVGRGGGALVAALWSLGAAVATAQEHLEQIEEIVVTTPFEETTADTALPVGIVSGERLREQIGASLGETLRNEAGLASASFGPGVGLPVIRGQSANRVSVLQNGISVLDASNISPDHANGVEPALAERLEVVRGPATLLYGSGAIGGVVNVIDNRIPQRLPDDPEFELEQSHGTVNGENKTVLRFDAASGRWGFHLDGFRRDYGLLEVPGLAIDDGAVEALEELRAELLGEEHGEDGEAGHEEEALENTAGFVGNTDGEARGGTAGFSWVGPAGFAGFAVNELRQEYGLPAGAHAHGHQDEDEEGHHEDEHGAQEEPEGEAPEEVEDVRVDLRQTRVDFRGRVDLNNRWLTSVTGGLGVSDYEHSEIEELASAERHVGTRYENNGLEGRLEVARAETGNWVGVWGTQFSDSDFSAAGEEAFIPRSDIASMGLFGLERYTGAGWVGELGLRVERRRIRTAADCESRETAVSFSASSIIDLGESANLLLAATRSQRTPTIEELYSNVAAAGCLPQAIGEGLVPHAATALLEIGNPQLGNETSRNFEANWRFDNDSLTAQVNAYHNVVADYVFLDITGEEFEEQAIAAYRARDARFTGFEAELALPVAEFAGSDLALNLAADFVRARFDAGGNLPRIPPAKASAGLRWYGERWSVHLHVTRAWEQDKVSALELPTAGYTDVALYGDYHLAVGGGDLTLFLRADNLLDDTIRNHVSFLKNFAPEPGRGLRLGLRLSY